MLMLAKQRKQIGSTEYEDTQVAFHWETVRRVVPCDEETVMVTFDDGEEMRLVGTVESVVGAVNMHQWSDSTGNPLSNSQVEYLA